MIFKCKICGGELNVERGQSIVECEYCGVKQTLPKFFDENVKLMYDRANNYLLHSEFDKAENIFNQILFADKEDADAYWSLVLCKYGISYVKDPMTGKYVPTCNRTYYSSIFDDENYKNALKYANEEKAELFKADAKTIDDIQHGIIAISKKEKPFDIFISYKETDLNGGRTKDSIAAQDLYEKLTNEGYKVFFSRITLEDKIGTEYEPYIYAALASSRVMITVCSSKENIESVWVKNEWSRFFSFSQKDSTKTILPLYFDMDKSELPDEFAHLPSYDMKTDGFEQDLIRGIKKLIPLPIMEKERREKRKKIFKKIGIGATACLVIAAICMIPWFMKLPDYNAAMQLYYDKNYPEAAWAFADLGKYRKSREMKDECEKSWRKGLATVVTDNYYISQNGYIESYDEQGLEQDLNSANHGNIISILFTHGFLLPDDNNDIETVYNGLYALYEDGTYSNSYVNKIMENIDSNNVAKSEYNTITYNENDVIQLIPLGIKSATADNSIMLALNSDGTVQYHKTWDKFNTNDDWLKSILSWKNIVKIYAYGPYDDYHIVIGITSNGKIKTAVSSNQSYYYAPNTMLSYTISDDLNTLNELDKIKNIDLRINRVYDNRQINNNMIYFDFAALNDNCLACCFKGEYSEQKIDSSLKTIELGFKYTESVNSESFLYSLYKDGRFIGNDKLLLKDVTYIQNGYAIKNSGEVYKYFCNNDAEVKPLNIKTRVYSEWEER